MDLAKKVVDKMIGGDAFSQSSHFMFSFAITLAS